MAVTSQKLIKNILSLPNAPIILSEVGSKLEEERKKRLDYQKERSKTIEG